MFAITVSHGVQAWRLLYKTQEKAEAAFKDMEARLGQDKTTEFGVLPRTTYSDDFGQRACLCVAEITGVMLEDLDQSKLGNIEMGLHQQRTQIGFQQRAQSDPILRAANAVRSPAMIDPTGFNGTRFS